MDEAKYAIRVSNLQKDFKLYAHPRQIISELLFNRQMPVFTALKNISFTVGRGEVVGIMGRNGAGKSTLLRIIAGTLDKTAGEVQVNGRLSAILELGTGFNPEYTGRENIFAGGACMGMKHSEILDKMDSIIAFSELEEFIDSPFKTYSSGMQARLTFATAVAIEPEILIVDEALAVGDARFQAKCYAKIKEFRDNGGSILLVTHSEIAITQFCDRAILLEKGQMTMDDVPRKVTKEYLEMVYCDKKEKSVAGLGVTEISHDNDTPVQDCYTPELLAGLSRAQMKKRAMEALQLEPMRFDGGIALRAGDAHEAEILDIAILDESNARVSVLESGRHYKFMADIIFYETVTNYSVGFSVRDLNANIVFAVNTNAFLRESLSLPDSAQGRVVRLFLDVTMWLTNQNFFLSVAIGEKDDHSARIIDQCRDYLLFSVGLSPVFLHASIVNLEPVFSGKMLSI